MLIEDGILRGYMQDRQNARLMGVEPTGNGRRESFAHLPMPRMTNTLMLAGAHDPQEIIASVKDGLYAVNFAGGQVDITSGKFVFSAAEAWKIEGGKLAYPVKGATLIGNGPDALTKVTMIGNDMALDAGHGSLRQGRAERARRRRPADAQDRGPDRRRHGVGASPARFAEAAVDLAAGLADPDGGVDARRAIAIRCCAPDVERCLFDWLEESLRGIKG